MFDLCSDDRCLDASWIAPGRRYLMAPGVTQLHAGGPWRCPRRCVETRGFTKAAERLGIAKAVVSQEIARLEAELGSSLLKHPVPAAPAMRLLAGEAPAQLLP
jgi:Bacterial regulatory helix-turn-helix protein, lysR family